MTRGSHIFLTQTDDASKIYIRTKKYIRNPPKGIIVDDSRNIEGEPVDLCKLNL